MFSVNAVIEWGGVLGIEKKIKKLLKGSWKARAQHWSDKYRKLHFQPQAMGRYNYTPRTKTYNLRKKESKRQTVPIPLVWNGESRDSAAEGRATSTFNSGSFTMKVPKLSYRPENSSIRMQDELRTVRPDENDELDRYQTKVLESAIQAYIDWKTENTGYQ